MTFGKEKGTWIWGFAKALINGVKAAEVDRIGRNISIICFNYDRCIEHYLETFLTASFHGMSVEEAREIVDNIQIIHPYGSLGSLKKFPFGDQTRFSSMAEELITWSETIADDAIIEDIQTAMVKASRVVFMGFAFANQNMKLLSTNPTEKRYNCPQIYSTDYGIFGETEDSLKANIQSLHSDAIDVTQFYKIHFQYETKCKEFFDIHRLNLVK